MNHREYVILKKVVSEIDIATELLGNETLESFSGDERTKRAVAMTVINVGELVKSLTEETRLKYNDVPWKQAAGFRDVAAHKYQTLRIGDVYETLKKDFPVFKKQIQGIIENCD